jgi:uncharacterized protein
MMLTDKNRCATIGALFLPQTTMTTCKGAHSMPDQPKVGTIGWHDIAVPDADAIRDFYASVVGWQWQALDMGGYSDYVMTAPGSDDGVSGICFARGSNANLPPVWLMYIIVADVAASAQKAVELGGKIIDGSHMSGASGFCVIQDPAGAICALYGASTQQ